MKRQLIIAICCWLFLFETAQSQAEVLIIHAGSLLAVPGEGVQTDQTIIVENGKVSRIEDGFTNPSNGRVVDLSCCFVLPGLIDLHVHLTSRLTPGGSLRVVTETSADPAIRATEFARLSLEAGFTTVLDLGTGRRAHEEAIVTATVNAAAALGMEDQVGSLQPGLSADLIAVAADPLADINELKKVVFVMREGVVYKNSF